jgi:hypothetical protein
MVMLTDVIEPAHSTRDAAPTCAFVQEDADMMMVDVVIELLEAYTFDAAEAATADAEEESVNPVNVP